MHSPQMNADERRFKHSELTEKIIGIFYDVYNELGFGFLESVYESALSLAFTEQGLAFERQVSIPVYFHNQKIGAYDADLPVGGLVLAGTKSLQSN